MYIHSKLPIDFDIPTFSLVKSPSQVSAQCQKWFLIGSIHCAKASHPFIFEAYGKNDFT